jgi:ribosomal protein RSM22 (predicted rRNA methylase)
VIGPDLPAELKAALDARLEGRSRGDVAARAAVISKTYRDGGTSSAIKSETDALAYALARMPATYAAISACLNAALEARPDFVPQTLLDVGAGPGTASWAASEAFPSLTSLTLLDTNPALRALALDLQRGSTRLGGLNYDAGEARAALAKAEAADLVIASYLIGELRETERKSLMEAMWARTRDMLLIVEPGTPAGYARILNARTQLIAAGAHVLAPCPHDHACPLQAPDWCHFSQRLNRSRDHRQVKGASLSFEDEKFSYVVLARDAPARIDARVLAHPAVTKSAITAKLCVADGIVTETTARRDREAYRRRKSWRWGDAVTRTAKPE